MPVTRDPRPLTGEPLALDLLNTRWNREGATQDLLADTDGLAVWLATNGLEYEPDARTLRHLRQARDALQVVVDGAPPEGAPLVDAVLEHGRIRAGFTDRGPVERAEFRDPAW